MLLCKPVHIASPGDVSGGVAAKRLFFLGQVLARFIQLGILRAQQDADRRVVAFGHHIPAVPGDIGVQLANVFVAECGDLQFHQDMAFENAVIEHEVHEVVTVTDQDTLLPRLETETVAQLEQKVVQLVEELILETGFAHDLLGLVGSSHCSKSTMWLNESLFRISLAARPDLGDSVSRFLPASVDA